MVVPPFPHQVLIILSRKTQWLLGKPTILGNTPHPSDLSHPSRSRRWDFARCGSCLESQCVLLDSPNPGRGTGPVGNPKARFEAPKNWYDNKWIFMNPFEAWCDFHGAVSFFFFSIFSEKMDGWVMMDRLQKTSTLQTNLYSARRGHVKMFCPYKTLRVKKRDLGEKLNHKTPHFFNDNIISPHWQHIWSRQQLAVVRPSAAPGIEMEGLGDAAVCILMERSGYHHLSLLPSFHTSQLIGIDFFHIHIHIHIYII